MTQNNIFFDNQHMYLRTETKPNQQYMFGNLVWQNKRKRQVKFIPNKNGTTKILR